MDNSNVTQSGSDITITEPGTYAITYSLTATPSVQGDLEALVQASGTEVNGSSLTLTNQATTPALLTNNVIAQLAAGDNVGLYLQSNEAANDVTVANATLTVKKLDADTTAA